MPALKLGLALAAWRTPLKQSLLRLTELQINAVELDARLQFRPADFGPSAVRQLRKTLADHLLRVGNVAYPTRRGLTTEQDLEARIAGIKSALKFASELGARLVTTSIGLIPDDLESPPGVLLTQVLTDLNYYSQHIGAQLCATTGPQGVENFQKLFAKLPLGCLALELNPGALAIWGHSALSFVEQLGEHVRVVHVNDAKSGFGTARGDYAELSHGEIDWPALLGTLQDRDYRGDFIIDRLISSDPDWEFEQGVKYLRNL